MLLVFRGCLVVRQSFFHNAPRNFDDLGGGVFGCRGFYSSFRPTNRGLSLNLGWNFILLPSISIFHFRCSAVSIILSLLTDVSTTMILKPGPVLDFLTANQNVNDPSQIDWIKVINHKYFFSSSGQNTLW